MDELEQASKPPGRDWSATVMLDADPLPVVAAGSSAVIVPRNGGQGYR
jgi:hypothetical protein